MSTFIEAIHRLVETVFEKPALPILGILLLLFLYWQKNGFRRRICPGSEYTRSIEHPTIWERLWGAIRALWFDLCKAWNSVTFLRFLVVILALVFAWFVCKIDLPPKLSRSPLEARVGRT